MDWNKNEGGDAAKASHLYSSKGRTGKKFAGNSSRDSRLAAHQTQFISAWRRIFKKKHGRWPSDLEVKFACIEMRVGQDVDDFVRKSPTTVISEGLTEDSKVGLAKMQEWLDSRKDEREAEAERKEIARQKDIDQNNYLDLWKKRARIRAANDSIPKKALERIRDNGYVPDSFWDVFDISKEELDDLLDAYFGK